MCLCCCCAYACVLLCDFLQVLFGPAFFKRHGVATVQQAFLEFEGNFEVNSTACVCSQPVRVPPVTIKPVLPPVLPLVQYTRLTPVTPHLRGLAT
jgi:hypothetical protein